MSLLDDPGLQKVWVDGRLIYDRATDGRSPAEALALELFGAGEAQQGTADLAPREVVGGF